MKALWMVVRVLFYAGVIGLCFVMPFYLMAIYPEVPAWLSQVKKRPGYGLIGGEASVIGFWYRFMACGAWVLVGVLILWSDLPNRLQKAKRKQKR